MDAGVSIHKLCGLASAQVRCCGAKTTKKALAVEGRDEVCDEGREA